MRRDITDKRLHTKGDTGRKKGRGCPCIQTV